MSTCERHSIPPLDPEKGGKHRGLFAVVEWVHHADEGGQTSAMCMGPLGAEFEETMALLEIPVSGTNTRVRLSPDEMAGPKRADWR
jgi:hypothetical protein